MVDLSVQKVIRGNKALGLITPIVPRAIAALSMLSPVRKDIGKDSGKALTSNKMKAPYYHE